MTPNPILKVLSTLSNRRVRYLLMGGQACVFYGAAEFSRDTDVAILASPANLDRLTKALADLGAACIAVPPYQRQYLLRGHAIHFRCGHPDATSMRIDVMSAMRGVAPFEKLWRRRTTFETESGTRIELMSLSDLVQAKKTQRDKDWPMLRRLVEAHYIQNADRPSAKHVAFWLKECRTPAILIDLARQHSSPCKAAAKRRSLLRLAMAGDESALAEALEEEAGLERRADREYWRPLRAELERLRKKRRADRS